MVRPGVTALRLPDVESPDDIVNADRAIGAIERERGLILNSIKLIAIAEIEGAQHLILIVVEKFVRHRKPQRIAVDESQQLFRHVDRDIRHALSTPPVIPGLGPGIHEFVCANAVSPCETRGCQG